MSVNRCVCFNVYFKKLKEIAEEHSCSTIEELQEHIDFGLGCGMCCPYVGEMLRTGQIEFVPLSVKDDE